MRKRFTILLILISVLGLIPVNFSLAITQNQINAEVQIVCPFEDNGEWMTSSDSGTIIDPKGIILTNKHVIKGAYKNTCFIGFTKSISQEPDFGTEENPYLAEVKYYTTADDMDAAVLYLDNPTSKTYPYINIWSANSDVLQFGDELEAIGYPSIGGSTITYTSGDFSGFGNYSDGTQNYIKATTPLEHGNSGGAAYNSAGQFIGIPTMVVAGTLNSLSYILSVNSIKNWLTNILGDNYQNQIINYSPKIDDSSQLELKEDNTPPNTGEVVLKVYSDATKSNELSLDNKNGSNILTPYFTWEGFYDKYGIKGYYIDYGYSNLSWSCGEVFTNNNFFVPDINCSAIKTDNPGRWFLKIKAVDNNNNITNEVIWEYHYKSSPTFEKWQSYQYENTLTNRPNNFYFYAYDHGVKGKLIATIKLDTSRVQGVKVPTNSILIEWDGINNKNFIKDVLVRFKKGHPYDSSAECSQSWALGRESLKCAGYYSTYNNYIIATNLEVGTPINFHMGLFALDNDKKTIVMVDHFHVFSMTATKKIVYKENNSFINKLNGQILLQVEAHGEAYYVYPKDGKRYYMANGNEAFKIMRNFGIGIKNTDLEKIKTSKTLAKKNSGKIFLQVEARGEAYYIDFNGNTHYLKDGNAAYAIMRDLGLGITNSDLSKIPEGSL